MASIGFLFAACAQAPKVNDTSVQEYCAGKVCVITEELKSTLNFYVKTSLQREFSLSFRLETANPSPSAWPQFQKNFVLKGPIEKQVLISLPLSSGAKPDYGFRFNWRLGSTKVAHDPKSKYILPFEMGKKSKVIQGNQGTLTHTANLKYALDFRLPIGTKVFAAREGEVVNFEDSFDSGKLDACFVDKGNFVTILHWDGTFALYDHLLKKSVKVAIGQQVKAGDEIAQSGNSGNSTEPHLHFEVYKNVDGYDRQTLPILFTSGDRKNFVPKYGDIF
jgi:murein DD-endopeptidase MepM/ murein hydrolase activator NlpD